MSDITVRALGEDEWEQYRSVRLNALEESPEAFVATADEERAFDEDFWRNRMRRSQRLLAEQDGAPVGVASVGQATREGEKDNAKVAELFGLWVAPAARGTGVATQLVQAGADAARQQGRSHLAYWVGANKNCWVFPSEREHGEREPRNLAFVIPSASEGSLSAP